MFFEKKGNNREILISELENWVHRMSKNFLLVIDLLSNRSFSEAEFSKIRGEMSLLKENNEFFNLVWEIIRTTKDQKIEIYAEDTGISSRSGEEILSLIKTIEEKVGGFTTGSFFEVGKDIPGISEKWTKSKYSWELEEFSEDEDPWGEENYWEEGWDEWNKEWN